MNVLVIVTHLLGSGHLARALTLARAFTSAGHNATVVSGGMPVPHLDVDGVTLVQLPPLRSDGVTFSRLLDNQGKPVSQDLFSERKARLTRLVQDMAPNVIITELFPFGRRILSDEFHALLNSAQHLPVRPLICASIRDILAPPSKPAKAQAAHAIIAKFYDAILVHSDPAVTPLQASWPVTSDLSPKLHYTGFIAPAAVAIEPVIEKADDILVSTGGGNVGTEVFAAAIAAATRAPDLTWRLFVGGTDAEARINALESDAPPNVTLQVTTPAFRSMLRGAKVSISLCGYNTVLDILQAGIPAVFIPFDEGGEVEQTLRAATLAPLDGIEVLKSADLSPDALIARIRAVITDAKRGPMTHNTRGAARSVDIIERLITEGAA
ncbi:MAG: glycosyltransferase family protein [Roseobacter sp.]